MQPEKKTNGGTSLLFVAGELWLGYLWLAQGIEGAGNLLSAWLIFWAVVVVLCLVGAPGGFPTSPSWHRLLLLWLRGGLCAALFWHGNFGLGLTAALLMLSPSLARQKAINAAAKDKA